MPVAEVLAVLDADGNARQAAVGGGWHEFPRSFFTAGSLGGVTAPCVTAEAQRLCHTGYECVTSTGWISTSSIDSVAVRCAGDEPLMERPR